MLLRRFALMVMWLSLAGCHPGLEHAAYSSVRDNGDVFDDDDTTTTPAPAPVLFIPDFNPGGTHNPEQVTGGAHEQDDFTAGFNIAPTEFRHDYDIVLACNSGICAGHELTGTAVLAVNTETRKINLARIDASSSDMAFHLYGMLESRFGMTRMANIDAELTHAETAGVWTFRTPVSSVFTGFDLSAPGIKPETIRFIIQSADGHDVTIRGLAVPGNELQ